MSRKRKKHRKLYVVLAITAMILLAGILAINHIVGNLVRKEMTKLLNSNPNSLYTVHFDDIRVNLFNGSLAVLNVTVDPRDTAYSILHEGKVNKLIHVRLPALRIRELDIMKFIREKSLDIAEIDLTGFSVDYLVNANAKAPENKKSLILHDLFSENFRGAAIGAIKLNADVLRFYHVDRKDSSFFEIDSVRVLIQQASLTPETVKNPIPLDFKDIRINTGHFGLNSMKYYGIATKDVHFDVMNSSLLIDGFRLVPKYSRSAYNQEIRHNSDWFSIGVGSIRVNNLNIAELEFDKLIQISSVVIEGADIEIYRDKRLPDAPFKYKPLLAGLVRKIPVELNIDTLVIREGKLRYQEQTSASDQPGTVFFDPLELKVFHVTNKPDLVAANREMTVDFRGKIMAEADLEARLKIDLSSQREQFTIHGTLSPVSGTVFNQMVEHMLPVRIMSADITKTSFNFSADDDIARGEVIMEYENLNVEVIKGKEHDKKAAVISAVANGLIKGHNMPDRHKYNTGTIRFERHKDKSIVNYLWNSCKTGIISIIAPIADHSKKDERKELKEENREEKEQKKGQRKK